MKDLTYIYIAGALIIIVNIVYYLLIWRKSGRNNLCDTVIVRLKDKFYLCIFILIITFFSCVVSALMNENSHNNPLLYPNVLIFLWFIARSITWKYKFSDIGISPVTGFKNLILTWDHVTYWKWLNYKPDYIFIEYENGKGNLQFKVSENKQLLNEMLTRIKGKSFKEENY